MPPRRTPPTQKSRRRKSQVSESAGSPLLLPSTTTTPPGDPSETSSEKEQLREKCDGLREKYGAVEKHAKKEIKELPRWVKVALTQYETEDITLKEAAARFGKSSSTLEKYASSPAGKKWRAAVEGIADDPEKLTEFAIRSTVMGVALDNLLAMQMALESGDFKEYGIMARDWLDRAGITKKQSGGSGGAQVLVIKMGQDASLEAPLVESSYEALPGEFSGVVVDAELLDE